MSALARYNFCQKSRHSRSMLFIDPLPLLAIPCTERSVSIPKAIAESRMHTRELNNHDRVLPANFACTSMRYYWWRLRTFSSPKSSFNHIKGQQRGFS